MKTRQAARAFSQAKILRANLISPLKRYFNIIRETPEYDTRLHLEPGSTD